MEVTLWIAIFLIISLGICGVINKINNKKKADYTGVDLIKSIPKPEELSGEMENDIIEIPWEIKTYVPTTLQVYDPPQPVVLTDYLRSHVENIIKISPNAKDMVQTERKVVIKFSEDVLKKFKTGELKLMKKKGTADKFRPIAVDRKNVIRKHGWLEVKDIKKLNPAQLANAVLGVMTVITAQEHLANINNQLKNMDKKINTIIRYYHNDKIGNIQGSIQYLKTILPDIMNTIGENEQVYLNKIEDISLQCYQDYQSVVREFPKIIEEINAMEVKTKFKMENIISEIKDKASLGEQYMHIALGNLEIQSICLKLRNELEGNSEVNINRLSVLEKDYSELVEYHDRFKTSLNEKQNGLNATFRFNETISKRKEEIAKQIEFHNENVRDNISYVDNHIQHLKNPSNTLLKDIIDLQVDFDEEDNIKALYKLKRVN